MICSDFERLCNETLDARSAGASGPDRDLDAHAASCEPCAAISARYRLLGHALAAWPAPPAPSPGSLARIRGLLAPPAATPEAVVPMPDRPRHAWRRLAAAAAILAAAWLGHAARNGPGRAVPPGPAAASRIVLAPPRNPAPAPAPIPTRSLEEALAEATEATIELAREASAPAARIGREAFDLERPGGFPAETSADADPARVSPPGLLGAVGKRVNAGIRPISGSARHAFSFLLGPVPEAAPETPPARDAS